MLNENEILCFEFTHFEVLDRLPIHKAMTAAFHYQNVIIALLPQMKGAFPLNNKTQNQVPGFHIDWHQAYMSELEMNRVLLFNDLAIEVRKASMFLEHSQFENSIDLLSLLSKVSERLVQMLKPL
jgi:hypothetical protein